MLPEPAGKDACATAERVRLRTMRSAGILACGFRQHPCCRSDRKLNGQIESGALESWRMITETDRSLSPLAGKPAPKDLLVDLSRLEREYYERQPDPADANHAVSFGTSGHRGSS